MRGERREELGDKSGEWEEPEQCEGGWVGGGGGGVVFFFNDTATTEIYTLSLHDALPILSKLQSQLQNNSICSSPRSPPNPQVSNTVFSLCLYN